MWRVWSSTPSRPGHTLRTRDGIILGKDTIAEARLKLKGRIDPDSYMSVRGEGKAYGQISVIKPIPAYPFTGTYSWLLNPAVADRQKPTAQDHRLH